MNLFVILLYIKILAANKDKEVCWKIGCSCSISNMNFQLNHDAAVNHFED
jgi:hypothetical protein